MVQGMAKNLPATNDEDIRNFMPLLGMFSKVDNMGIAQSAAGKDMHGSAQLQCLSQPPARSAPAARLDEQSSVEHSAIDQGRDNDEGFLDILEAVMNAWEEAILAHMQTCVQAAIKSARSDVMQVRMLHRTECHDVAVGSPGWLLLYALPSLLQVLPISSPAKHWHTLCILATLC